MCNWCEGGAGQRVSLFSGSSLGYLFPEGFWETTLEELSAGPELFIILGVFGTLTAAVVKDGDHRRHFSSCFLFRPCKNGNVKLLVYFFKRTIKGDDLEWEKTTWVRLESWCGFTQNIIQTPQRFLGFALFWCCWRRRCWRAVLQADDGILTNGTTTQWVFWTANCFKITIST